ncbi:MAG: BPTI/Kunitz-type proteinase inhibitor domain-containing protein [Limisphaerales bacterium]
MNFPRYFFNRASRRCQSLIWSWAAGNS